MSSVRIKHVASEIRTVIPRENFAHGLVQHYSIPAFDTLGGPQIQPGAEISSDKLAVEKGDVLVSKLNPHKSRVQVVAAATEEFSLSSTEFVGLRAHAADPQYLYWLLRSEPSRQGLVAVMKSVTRSQQRAQPDDILALPVPVVDPSAQHQAADFLDRECERIDLLTQAIEKLENQASSIATALFDERTAPYPRVRVRHVIKTIEQGWSPECDGREPDPQEWGVLKLGCVNAGRFTYQAKALARGLEPRPNHTVAEGDVLVSRANTRDLVGSCAIVTSEVQPRTMFSDLLYRLTPDDRKCTREFLAAALGAPLARSQIEALAVGSAGSMPKLAQGAIKQLAIPSLELQEQREILSSLEDESRPLAEIRHEGEHLRISLAQYRDALITEAVMGKLDVTLLSEQQLDESARAVMEDERPEVLA